MEKSDLEKPPVIVVEKRPWGWFRQFTLNDPTTVKVFRMISGEEFSLQFHKNRAEFWHIISGTPKITIGEKTRDAKKGDEFFIPRGTKHRMEAVGGDVEFLEISFGHFNEEDIVRLQDKYGRV